MDHPPRDFIGYGMHPPHPHWPGGALLSVSIVVNYNVGAEKSLFLGDDSAETALLENPARSNMTGRRSDQIESQYEYGGREGVRRLLELFERFHIPSTFNAATLALEQAPYWTKRILASGAELSCAGDRYIDYSTLKSHAEEERHLSKAIDTLQRLSGDPSLPHGWMIGDRASEVSQKLYARAHAERGLPLWYSSDSTADDLPYWVRSPSAGPQHEAEAEAVDGVSEWDRGHGDDGLLVIPFSHDCGDWRFLGRGAGWSSPKDFYEYLVDAFDYLYEEGREGEPKMMTVVVHPHIIGHGGRMFYFRKFIEYITAADKRVWIARRDEIAAHWRKVHPYKEHHQVTVNPVMQRSNL